MTQLRSPDTVMRLARLGALHQCRLSFMRQLTRRLAQEAWTFERTQFELDARGVGHAVYVARGPERTYSLVAFSHDLPDALRSDRVIAEAWDATFTLFDGVPEPQDIDRLSQNVPLQEAGRVTERELTLSRANRSGRLWTHVVDCLARGAQPDADDLAAVGYLMRTTAVYGSGKFGAADRDVIADRPELSAPFQAEMLTVYLIRWCVRDLVEAAARTKGGDRAVRLDSELAVSLGIGNSTGLGMAPFLINHPRLLNNWIAARETALARVRELETASAAEQTQFLDLFQRTRRMVEDWNTSDPVQSGQITGLAQDLERCASYMAAGGLLRPYPWDHLLRFAETGLSLEGQECIASLILEPYPAIVDDLAASMADPSPYDHRLDGNQTLNDAKRQIETAFGWALETDWSDPAAVARVWYVSEEKLEPRLGERFEEPVAPYEHPLAPARDACGALTAMAEWPRESTVAAFVAAHPEHRQILLRAQRLESAPYGEIRDNTVSAGMRPVDMLRAKLSFFGATRFDPRSDRWVRICMFAGAPYPADLRPETSDFWVYPSAVQ